MKGNSLEMVFKLFKVSRFFILTAIALGSIFEADFVEAKGKIEEKSIKSSKAAVSSTKAAMQSAVSSAKISGGTAAKNSSKASKRKRGAKKSPRQDFVDRITKPVVGIVATETTSGSTEASEEKIDGSGFIVDPDGFVVTNCHVIDGASAVDVVLYDGSRYSARIVGSDSNSDIALLKIDLDASRGGEGGIGKTAGFAGATTSTAQAFGATASVSASKTGSASNSSASANGNPKFRSVTFADSDEAYMTMPVYAVGYPFGFGMSATSGIISQKKNGLSDYGINIPLLQTDARINYGNSGGPLFTNDGRVIGMVTVFVAEGSQNTGLGFAIPSNLLQRNIEQLKLYGKLRKSWVGFLAIPLDREVVSALGLGDHHAFAVVSVEKGSPADEAGMCPGDLVLSINGEDMRPDTNLKYILKNLPIDEVIQIVAVRSKQEMVFDLKVGIKNDEVDSSIEEPENSGDQHISYQEIDCLSIGVADLTNKLRDHFEFRGTLTESL